MTDEIDLEQPISEQLTKISAESTAKLTSESTQEHEARKTQQAEVLKLFNEEALANIKAAIIAEAIRTDSEPTLVLADHKRLKGAIFETFSLIEYESKYMRKPADANTLTIGQELAHLHKFPPKNLEKQLENMRDPDLIEIETDTRTDAIYIKKTVEATTDRLGIRKYAQLTETEDALKELVGLLDKIPEDYAVRFTPNLLKYKNKIRVKEGIDRTLVLSADKDLDNKASYFADELQTRSNRDIMEEFMDELDDVEVLKSSFSSSDVEQYIDFFTKKLEKSL